MFSYRRTVSSRVGRALHPPRESELAAGSHNSFPMTALAGGWCQELLLASAKAEQFSRLDVTGGPSKSHRDPLGRYNGCSPWCINQPQHYDKSPV